MQVIHVVSNPLSANDRGGQDLGQLGRFRVEHKRVMTAERKPPADRIPHQCFGAIFQPEIANDRAELDVPVVKLQCVEAWAVAQVEMRSGNRAKVLVTADFAPVAVVTISGFGSRR